MSNIDAAIYRLKQLNAALEDPVSAYSIRSRLGRLTLTVRGLCDSALDQSDRAEVEMLLDRLEQSFAVLRLKSEPFGEAWIASLHASRDVLQNLAEKIEALRSYR